MNTPARIVALSMLVVVTGLFTTIGNAQNARWQPLRDDAEIHSGLTVIAVGRHIHNVCPDISARMLLSLSFAQGLMSHAQSLGFTRSEVTEFIDDRTEQARYREVARAYFEQNGADMSDPEAVCRVGRDEIATGSQIGRLLRQG